MVVRLSGTQPQGPKHLEILENKTLDGTQNTVRVNRGTSANRPIGAVIGDLYYNTEFKDLEQYTEDGWMLVAKQPPRIPTIGSASLDGSNNALVSFTPSAYGQSATSYIVQSNPGSFTASGSSSPISLSGTNLEIGTPYTFRVRSVGSYGQSAYSGYTSSAVVPIALGNYESIATVTVGAGGATSITFNSIPSTYTHLQIRYMGKGTSALGGYPSGSFLRFNDDNTANYTSHNLRGNGSSAAAGANVGEIYMNEVIVPGLDGWNSTTFGVGIIDILDYANTNKFKTIRSLNGADNNGSGAVYVSSSNWRSTNAITKITLNVDPTYVSSYAQNSQIALYGIKGS